MTTKASAPGKVILLGEHAAVYGNSVLVASIEKRSYVTVTSREDEKCILNNPLVGLENLEFSLSDIPTLRSRWNTALTAETISKTFDFLGTSSGLEIEIHSDIPISSGLGSSASIASAMVLAISAELGKDLTPQENAQIAWDTENLIHKKSSGVDPFSVTYGGVVKYRQGEIERLNVKKYPEITIGNTKVRSDTGDVVMDVMHLKDNFPVFFETYLKIMEGIVEKGITLLEKGDLERFGQLMNINHGLLSSIGVSCFELENLVWAARKKSFGAKLCGAGRGGIMLALGDSGKEISDAGGEVIKTRFSDKGAKIEK